ncbi:MAG: mechanosensitive ion channel family protein [Candidatus Woesearchaeota archaeon]
MVIETIINYEFLGNEVWRYIVAVVIVLLTIPLGKIVSSVCTTYINQRNKHEKKKFDVVVIKAINPTVTLFVLAINFFIAKSLLKLGEYDELGQTIFNLLLIIPLIYFAIRFSTEAVSFYLKSPVNNGEIDEAALDLIMQVLRVALFVIGILLILSNLGYNISALLAGLGVGGLAFALAAQDILKNFFSGLSLIIDKTFTKGDMVTFGGTTGFVEELRLRSTKLRTFEGSVLTVPNTILANDVVENVYETPKVRISMVIGLKYETSSEKLKKAKEIIHNALKKHPDVDDQSSWVYFDNFGSYSLDIQVIYLAKELVMSDWPKRAYMKEEINFAIKDGFEKEGIEMAFPTQTVELNQNLQELSKNK